MNLSVTQDVLFPGGAVPNAAISRSASGGLAPQEYSLPAANAGTLSTRTSDTAGTLTLDADHDLADGDVIDIHWVDADGLAQFAYGATVGTVDGTSVPFTGAAGTILPAEDYAIVADEQVALDIDFDAAKLVALFACCDRQWGICFRTSVPAVVDAQALLGREPYQWATGSPYANPLGSSVIASITISSGSSSGAGSFKAGGVYNSDE